MSDLSTSPAGSRLLEQLKVAELRDELKKSGMSLKGSKKELFERSEEAIKKEGQDGIVDGQHRAVLEGGHNINISDGTDDCEEGDEALDETNDKASNIHDTMNVHPTGKLLSSRLNDLLPSLNPSDVLLKIPLSTIDEAIPVSETHALTGVSAPDGVPGFNEDRHHLSAASAASVGTNNDVLFVDNAVCENGDGMLLPPRVADMLEPGKETSGNQEIGPEITTADPETSKNTDEAPESGIVVSDVMNASIENSNAQVAADIVVSANDASRTCCSVHDDEKKNLLAGSEEAAQQLSKSETLIEPSPPEVENKALMQSALDSGLPVEDSYQQKESGDLKTEVSSVPFADPGKPVADERDIIVNQEKPNAKMEPMEINAGVEENHGQVIAGEMEKSDTKRDPMEVDAGLEDKHKLISGGIKELQIDAKMEQMEVDAGIEDTDKLISEKNKEIQNDKEDPFQPQSLSKELQVKEVKLENSSCLRESRGKESRVQDKCKRTAPDNADLKSLQDGSQACANLRRKDPEMDSKQQEPSKRMRRWNSGKEATGDALKPSTTDTVKEKTLPKSMESSFVGPQKLTPKAVATSRELAPKVKVEPDSVSPRTVPPSARAPSNSLKIERFVRPFTLKAVKDLLSEFGQCVDFWMDQIKTHCFVTYSSSKEAVAARNALYGRQWPPSVGHFLVAEFVDVNEVKMRSEWAAEKAQPAALLQNANLPPPPPRVMQSTPSFRSSSTTFPISCFSRERQLTPIPKKDPEPAGLMLEDLFFKTKAKPSIYYLPLTDEQVAEKLAAAKKINKPSGSK